MSPIKIIDNLLDKDSHKIIHVCSDKIINRVELANMILKYSLKSKKMNYSECLFKDIPYLEPRGRVNNLDNSLSKKLLKMNYIDANKIILDKISYIDKMNWNEW